MSWRYEEEEAAGYGVRKLRRERDVKEEMPRGRLLGLNKGGRGNGKYEGCNKACSEKFERSHQRAYPVVAMRDPSRLKASSLMGWTPLAETQRL